MVDAVMRPFVLRGWLDQFGSVLGEWTPDKIASLCSQRVRMRVGSKMVGDGRRSRWESDCHNGHTTIADMLKWYKGTGDKFQSQLPANATKLDPEDQNQDQLTTLAGFDPQSHWCYLDYKDAFELFDDQILSSIDWSRWIPEIRRSGLDTTVWLGTDGADTPCHYDSYGFNLVAQMYGRKRWLMFSPSDSDILRPTRVPYEESSIFSQLDVASLPEELKKAHIYAVTLNAGDLLYVPSYWWHYVQCRDLALTLNTWVPIASDRENRLREAIIANIVMRFLQNSEPNLHIDNVLNPTQILWPISECSELLKAVFAELKNKENVEFEAKKPRLESEFFDEEAFFAKWSKKGELVTETNWAELTADLKATGNSTKADGSSLVEFGKETGEKLSEKSYADQVLLEALTHPKTIDCIVSLLKDKLL